MCLRPIKILNPTKRIAIRGGQALALQVPCNGCAECQVRRRDEYSFRTYWHSKGTIDKGGYVLFDTLTYSDKHLPRLSDFVDVKHFEITDHSCFNLNHYKLFFKKLRRRVETKYKIKNALSYFFASEYGEDDRYTHRPHYHFMLFVNNPVIHPLWLSRTIAQCWQYGRTDGIVYKDIQHVARHIYGYNLGFGSNTETSILRAVTHYVAKYILKSSEFQKVIDKRIEKIEQKLIVENKYEELKEILKQISLFHRHSQGYGLAYLENLDDRAKRALQYDTGIMPDQDKIIKEIPLPLYYMRKLYYEQIKVDDKKLWQLTEIGIQHKLSCQSQMLDKKKSFYETLYVNTTDEFRADVDRLLDGRELFDFIVYELYYKGRLRHHSSLNYITYGKDYHLSEYEQLDTGEWQSVIANSYLNNSVDDRCYFASNETKDVTINHFIGDELDPEYQYYILDKKDFIRNYTFNQDSDPKFKNFDLLHDLFQKIKRHKNELQQETYDFLQEYKQKMKNLYPITS